MPLREQAHRLPVPMSDTSNAVLFRSPALRDPVLSPTKVGSELSYASPVFAKASAAAKAMADRMAGRILILEVFDE